jgi:hypothetical protein
MSVRSTSVVRSVAAALAADAAVQARLTNGSVQAHRQGPAPTAATWVRITVRELNTGGVVDRPGHVPVPVQVVAECHGHPDPDLALEAALEAAHAVLEGFKPDTPYGDALLGAARRRRPTPATHDDRTDAYVSAALYEISTTTPS